MFRYIKNVHFVMKMFVVIILRQISCWCVNKARNICCTGVPAVRGCLPDVVAEDKCANSSYGGITGTVCSCRGNLCNYALPMGSSIIVMAAALIVYVVLRNGKN
ncbi:hypothetical protein ACJMK2_002140 [Sinanodonta woodiana]|uniref:Uncharacterized protein n=1 Tax=Sinanodonta woodiana TaxID=1069815 RepID=A0ABD3XUY2_SINWO